MDSQCVAVHRPRHHAVPHHNTPCHSTPPTPHHNTNHTKLQTLTLGLKDSVHMCASLVCMLFPSTSTPTPSESGVHVTCNVYMRGVQGFNWTAQKEKGPGKIKLRCSISPVKSSARVDVIGCRETNLMIPEIRSTISVERVPARILRIQQSFNATILHHIWGDFEGGENRIDDLEPGHSDLCVCSHGPNKMKK